MIIQDDIGDTATIIKDLNELFSLSIHDQIAAIKADNTWASIPSIKGGHHPLRTPSVQALIRLTARLIDAQPQAADYDHNSVQRHLAQAFSSTYLEEHANVTAESVSMMLNRAITAAKAEHMTITHHIPCIAMAAQQPDHVSIGPVRLTTSDRFLRDHHDDVEAFRTAEHERAATYANDNHLTLKTPADAIHLVDRIIDGTNEFYSDHNWTATITIPACHERISRERAERAARAAIDILKLVFVHNARHARIGNARQLPGRTRTWTTIDGTFHDSMTVQGESILGTEGWHQGLRPTGRFYLRLAGIPLWMYTHPDKACDIGRRYLDALHWYGEAISETSRAAASVKYATSLERLTITPDIKSDFTKHVTERSAILAAGGNKKIYRAAKKAVSALYKERSEYLHGRRSPHEHSTTDHARTIVPIIFRYLELARILTRQGKTTDNDLAREYKRVQGNP